MSAQRGSSVEIEVPAPLLNRLADLITDEDDRMIIATLREAMTATKSVRYPREIGQPNNYALVPDWSVRVAAAKIMAEMKHGRPHQSLDLSVRGNLNAPMSREAAVHELMANWDDVRRIGDEHVRLLQESVRSVVHGADAPKPGDVVDVDVSPAGTEKHNR